MKINVWVLSTSIPEDNGPGFPQVFSSAQEADKAFLAAMKEEWAAYFGVKPHDDRTFADYRPFPDGPLAAHEAHRTLRKELEGDWGMWEITGPHEVEVTL